MNLDVARAMPADLQVDSTVDQPYTLSVIKLKKNAFLINGHQSWEIAPGKLNKSLIEIARKAFIDKGYEIQFTHIEDEYSAAEEVEKFIRADIILFQTPVYWMSIPWGFKKYIDEVYMAGYGTMFDDDGRTRSDANAKYGSGHI